MSFIAGAYSATWNSLSLGQAERGYRILRPGTGEAAPIRGENYGMGADQDAVFIGGNCFIEVNLLEWNAAAIETLINNVTHGRVLTPGQLLSGIWQPLVLTRIASGSVVNATPAVRTFNRVCLAQGQQLAELMAAQLKVLPLRLQAYPYLNGSSQPVYFTDS
jgi:hypothetical protein